MHTDVPAPAQLIHSCKRTPDPQKGPLHSAENVNAPTPVSESDARSRQALHHHPSIPRSQAAQLGICALSKVVALSVKPESNASARLHKAERAKAPDANTLGPPQVSGVSPCLSFLGILPLSSDFSDLCLA